MKKIKITKKIISAFKNHLENEEKSLSTIQKYIRDVTAFMLFLSGGEITKESVIEYKQSLIEGGYTVCSVNSMLASLNSLFTYLGRHDLKAKTIKVQRKIFCSEEKELTKAEYERLCRTAQKKSDNRLYLILLTICSTGIRVSELQYITEEAVRKGEAIVSCKGKTRSVFIVNKLQKKLLRYIAVHGIKSGPVFTARNGKPLNRTTVWREMKSLCAEAKVSPSKVFPHNLRHLFARIFYNIEKDIAKLADILGHSSINTTRIYIISTGAEHRRQIENMRLIL